MPLFSLQTKRQKPQISPAEISKFSLRLDQVWVALDLCKSRVTDLNILPLGSIPVNLAAQTVGT